MLSTSNFQLSIDGASRSPKFLDLARAKLTAVLFRTTVEPNKSNLFQNLK